MSLSKKRYNNNIGDWEEYMRKLVKMSQTKFSCSWNKYYVDLFSALTMNILHIFVYCVDASVLLLLLLLLVVVVIFLWYL